MSLRSRHLRADAARIGLAIAVLGTAACEAVYGLPQAASSEDETGAPGLATTTTGEAEDHASTGTSDPDDDAEGEVGEVGGGAFDLGPGDPEDPPPPNAGDCCLPGRGTGCGDDLVEACVCAVDRVCCESGWDELCAKEARELGCTTCIGDTGPMTFGASCCEVSENPGCPDDSIASCVCATDPYCCMVAWDQVCIDYVAELGCGDCSGGLSACCTPMEVPGCADAPIEECVCAQDTFCCDTAWDELCTTEVESLGCGSCSFEQDMPNDDCCVPSMGAGCNDPGVTECVCAVDPYCCEAIWDEVCIGQVDQLGCGSCYDVGTTGANDGGTEGTTGMDPGAGTTGGN